MLHFTTTICAISLLIATPLSADNHRAFSISGWREILVSVSNPQQQASFFEHLGGWEKRYTGNMDPRQLASWNLPDTATATEILMANKGADSGFIRLVNFKNIAQRRIRSNDQAWDTGGIFDFNLRVKDLDKIFAQMQHLGWLGYSDPQRFTFGKFHVTEWIARGPDGMAMALVQRHKPKLEGWPNLNKLSRTFNSTQVVKDMAASRSFYMDILGFKKYLYSKGVSKNDGQNVLGLPLNLAQTVTREVWILHPQGTNEGSVELLSYDGLTGRDFSTKTSPPNLGSLMLRFPVQGIDALTKHLEKHGIVTDITNASMPPYGEVRRFTLQSPNGSWLEFFEEQD